MCWRLFADMSDAPAVSRGGVDASGHASDYSESTTDEKGPLPDGWRLIVNGGHRFYYHAFSDVSQWLRPKGAPPKQVGGAGWVFVFVGPWRAAWCAVATASTCAGDSAWALVCLRKGAQTLVVARSARAVCPCGCVSLFVAPCACACIGYVV